MSSSNTIHAGTDTSARELEELIDNAPRGATIKLSSGNYTLDDSINITRSDISLVGSGSDKTTLTFSDKALDRNDTYGLRLDGQENWDMGRLASSIDKGSRQLKLDQEHDLEAGDTVRIWQDNDSEFLDEIGDTSWRKQKYAELRTSMAKVESVDGKSVKLDRGVHFDFDRGDTEVERLETVDDVTLEGFTIDFEPDDPDPSAFKNTMPELKNYSALSLNGTVDSELSDIKVVDTPSVAFRFSKSLDSDVNDIEAEGSFNKGSGGNGYAYELHESYDGDFTNLTDSGMRHGLLFASWRSSVGNDVQIDSTDRDINFHGGRDHDNTVHVERSIRDEAGDNLSPTLWINSGGESFGAITDEEANEVTFDYVMGSRRDDDVNGSDDGVYLNGGLGNDTLNGGDGDDILQGGPGNDWIDGDDILDGGDGDDTARYTQDYDDYDIWFDDGEVFVKHKDKGSRDTLDNIEKIVFGDGTVLDTKSKDTWDGDELERPSISDILDNGSGSSEEADSESDVAIIGKHVSTWSKGHVTEIIVENTSDEDIADPEISFDLSSDIDTLWNGRIIDDENGYRIADDNSNTLESGESWRFVFKTYNDEAELPNNVNIQDGNGSDLNALLVGTNEQSYDDVIA
ncbi:alginate biosynthesis protein [Halomonas sp. GXIMD04776]|uniref:alginate biosynthesis protein n=1 Tax=Halomonas sp. GXIMD04776 TaxID=3415605 RepID=UPI003CA0122E